MAEGNNFRRVCKISSGAIFANSRWPPSLTDIMKMVVNSCTRDVMLGSIPMFLGTRNRMEGLFM